MTYWIGVKDINDEDDVGTWDSNYIFYGRAGNSVACDGSQLDNSCLDESQSDDNCDV